MLASCAAIVFIGYLFFLYFVQFDDVAIPLVAIALILAIILLGIDKANKSQNEVAFTERSVQYDDRWIQDVAVTVKNEVAVTVGGVQSSAEETVDVELQTGKKFGLKVRRYLWSKYNHKCYICNCELPHWTKKHMHLDHIKPFARGGVDDISNLAPACPKCNREKSDADYPELYSKSVSKVSERNPA